MPSRPKEISVWLFPLTYVLHLGEEYWGGEGFPAWLSRLADVSFTKQEFVTLNSFALVLMTIGATLIYRHTWRWLLVALAGVVLINSALHLVSSVLTWTYSPGLVTGVLLWLPLGLATLIRQWPLASRRSFKLGLTLAFGLHVIVSWLAFIA